MSQIERGQRELALRLAGEHSPDPSTEGQIVSRAEKYLAFLRDPAEARQGGGTQ